MNKDFALIFNNERTIVVRSQDGQHHVLIHKDINVINTKFKGHDLIGDIEDMHRDGDIVYIAIYYATVKHSVVLEIHNTEDGINVLANNHLVIRGGTL